MSEKARRPAPATKTKPKAQLRSDTKLGNLIVGAHRSAPKAHPDSKRADQVGGIDRRRADRRSKSPSSYGHVTYVPTDAPKSPDMYVLLAARKGEKNVKSIISRVGAKHEGELAARLVADLAADNPDVKALCETYGLKREELGRLTGFSLRALAEWANKKLPSEPARRRLREVRRLLDALAGIVKVESIPRWLHRTNPEFAPLTPLQVIELGEIDRLWAMVYHLGSGQPD